MLKRLKLVLFGAGLVGRRVLPRYLARFDIVAMVDNDPAKHSKKISNINIVSADQLSSLQFDFIVITSTSSAQIYDQLIDLGYPNEIIKEATEVQGTCFPWDAVIFLLLILFLGSMLMVFLL